MPEHLRPLRSFLYFQCAVRHCYVNRPALAHLESVNLTLAQTWHLRHLFQWSAVSHLLACPLSEKKITSFRYPSAETSKTSAIAASVFRLYYSVLLMKQADYSYVKEQASIWTHAELSFGLICSCLFVLPRLYRHLASIPPYGSDEYDDYQRRKPSRRWWSEQTSSRGRVKDESGKTPRLGGLDTDVEKPWSDDGVDIVKMRQII